MKPYSLDTLNSDEILSYLKSDDWSVGEVADCCGWIAYADKDELHFEGCGPRQLDAWRSLMKRMDLAGRLSRN